MKQTTCISLTLVLLGLALPVSAATYYVSSTSGLDANTPAQAQSRTSPWAHLPCMANATSNAGAYVPVAGDVFILKGGDTWGNASFPCTWKWSGSTGNQIEITADQTWYLGASWTRPVWDAGGSPIAGQRNTILWFNLSSVQFVKFSSIEMKRFHWNGNPSYGTCAQVLASGASNITLDNIYMHAWTHQSFANGGRDSCPNILGDTNPPFMVGSVLQNSIIDGSDSTGGGDSGGTYAWPSFINNVMRDLPNFFLPLGNATISGNHAYNCNLSFDDPVHENFLETLGGPSSGFKVYIHNNVFHDSVPGCETAFLGNPGETDYVWNNVWYNLGGNAPEMTQNVSPGVAAYFWNNTIVPPSGQPCIMEGHSGTYSVIEFVNNHCISTATSVDEPSLTASTKTIRNNVLQTPSAAMLLGYTATQRYAYSPTSTQVGLGVTPSIGCTGPLASLCSDTIYGSDWSVITKTISGPGRTSFVRPMSGPWYVGAYQVGGDTDLQPPGPPQNVSVR